MLKSIQFFMEENVDGTFFVLFTSNNQSIKGNIPSELMPENYEELSIQDLPFNVWEHYLTTNISKEVANKLEEKSFIENLGNCSYLTKSDDLYYRLNNTISVPKEIVKEYIKKEQSGESIVGLDNFWYFLSTNQSSVKKMLYSWLQKDEFKITDEGMIVTYKNVIPVKNDLDDFVIESWNKVKKWKQNPSKYYINKGFEVNSLTTQKTSLNLRELYNKIGKVFTHEYNSSDRLYYEIGKETCLDRSKCDYSDNTCGSGINSMSKSFLELNGQSYYGNTTICCLVNPSNVISAPTEEGYNKMRECGIYPVCTVEWKDGKIVEPDWSTIQAASVTYNRDSIIDLDKFINSTFEDENPKFIGVDKIAIRKIINI